MLESGRWSGNIRELQNVIEKAVILSEAKNLSAKDIQIDARSGPGMTNGDSSGNVIPGLTGNLLHNPQEEERMVREAVLRSNGNISAAAKMLGISRPTLYAKMKKYGL